MRAGNEIALTINKMKGGASVVTHRFAFGIDEYGIQLYSQDTNKLAGTAASTK